MITQTLALTILHIDIKDDNTDFGISNNIHKNITGL